MPGQAPKIWKVSELNSEVKAFIEANFAYSLWLEGEISGLTIHSSGHVYFSLKDRNSQIRATFFNGAAEARRLRLQQGGMVEAFGRISVYQPRGEYQFNAVRIRPKGVGDLHLKFEELKAKLQKEGLFDQSRKKPIPVLPLRIGVVTSPDGAAIRDFLEVINHRFPNLHIRIYPAAVQGAGAEVQIADGIRFFNENKFPDVIVITRGGGSIEDLWAFNEETLARTIADSAIPVISAVGHEVDFTIADFVADMRAPTPTAAAEAVIAREDEFLATISDFKRRSEMALRLNLEKRRYTLSELKTSRIFSDPLSIIRDKQQTLDDLTGRLADSIEDTLSARKNSLDILSAKIAALSPFNVLERGYSILQKKADGAVVGNSGDVSPGDKLIAILAKGRLDLAVSGKNEP